MLVKYLTAALAGTALLATVASAQTPTTTSDRANTSASTSESSFKGDWRASKVVGLKVYNDNNESLGSINDLLMDKSGNIKAAVIGVGGFLGVGEHLVAVPLDKIKFVNEPVAYTGTANSGPSNGSGAGAGSRPATPSTAPSTTTGSAGTGSTATTSSKSNQWYPDHAMFSASKDSLKAMPEFKYSTD
jgi:sporulation protein YlmC with PRC-barrel domain